MNCNGGNEYKIPHLRKNQREKIELFNRSLKVDLDVYQKALLRVEEMNSS